MNTEILFTDDHPLRFKIIRPVYETLTVNDKSAQCFEPLEAITSSSHVVRLFDLLSRENTRVLLGGTPGQQEQTPLPGAHLNR